jgi:hypothetical protein
MKTITKHMLVVAPLIVGAAMIGCQSDEPVGLPLSLGGQIGTHDSNDNPTDDGADQTASGTDNSFEHMKDLSENGGKDPFEVLAQRQEEGPPEIRTRLHSCQKLRVVTLRNILADFGVKLDAQAATSAGQLLAKGTDALGAANYAARNGEALVWSNSGATKVHDIFVQAAPEIIAAMPNVARCKIDEKGVSMFDENNQCNEDAITCLIGKPATLEHVKICNQAVATATDVNKGKAIAVAAMLAAAHTCE